MKKTPSEICAELRGHAEGFLKILQGIHGDPGSKVFNESHAYPEEVREKAYDAIKAFNRWWKVDMSLPELHDAMGLGPLNVSGACGHELEKNRKNMKEGA